MIYRTHSLPLQRRKGFSLVELLIVVLIIAILVGLVTVAVAPFVRGQSARTTENLLPKVTRALHQRWTEVQKKAATEPIPPGLATELDTQFGADPTRNRVIWIKLRLKQHFPMSYQEALYPGGGIISLPSLYKHRLVEAGIIPNTPTPTPPAPTYEQSGACLLLALTRAEKGQQFNPDEVLGPSAVKDTDGDGLPEIVDGWDRSVFFFRWTCKHPDVQAEASNRGKRAPKLDPEDPDGRLIDQNWHANNPTAVTTFEALCHPIRPLPNAYFTIPVIVSFGKDGQPGLGNFMEPTSAAAEDNIYSYLPR